MKVNRSDLLMVLESVAPGLSSKELIEQSACLAFKGGLVMTYNDEVAVRRPSGLEDSFEGAVKGRALIDVLKALKDDEVELTVAGGEEGHKLVVHAKRTEVGVAMDPKIELPIDTVPMPEKWRTLHEDFTEALTLVHQCAGKNESEFATTCVHICPEWVEAMDNNQMIRYRIPTKVRTPVLVRKESVKQVAGLDVTKVSESPEWIHFSNSSGLVFSCRTYSGDDFLDLEPLLSVPGGVTSTLPKGLTDAIGLCEIFSKEVTEKNEVLVELRPGKLRIRGDGVSGYAKRWYKLRTYTGAPMAFMIPPSLLLEIVTKYNECDITEHQLKVDGGKFAYVTSLGTVEDKDDEPAEDGTD